MRLTTASVHALMLPPSKSDCFIWDQDLPGFGVRLHSGSKRWVVQYRINGRQRRESLGDVRKVTLDDARSIARKRFASVELGVDPTAQRKQAKAEATAIRLTLGLVADRYLDAKADVTRPSTQQAARRYFSVHWAPLRNKPIDAINRADVAARLQELTKERGRSASSRARDYLRSMYGWAMREGLCEANPAASTNDPAAGAQPRDRVLSDEEIGVIWRACEGDDFGFGRIVKLLLLTGARREEIGGLTWSEVNLETGLLTIDGSRTKNHKTLELPLPALALDILKSVPRLADRDHVFCARGGGYSAWSYSTARLKTKIAEAGKTLAGWRLHDLRRTFRTGLGRLGVPPHIAELCINHVKGGVEAIYDRHRYQREIRDALALWAAHVQAVVSGGRPKVVPMKRDAS